jgi:hypothetical protein
MTRRSHSERPSRGNVFTADSISGETRTNNLPLKAVAPLGLNGFKFSSFGLGLGIDISLTGDRYRIAYMGYHLSTLKDFLKINLLITCQPVIISDKLYA